MGSGNKLLLTCQVITDTKEAFEKYPNVFKEEQTKLNYVYIRLNNNLYGFIDTEVLEREPYGIIIHADIYIKYANFSKAFTIDCQKNLYFFEPTIN